MYIYSNIVQPRLVGDGSVRLLRAVTTTGDYHRVIKEEFKNIQYVPLEFLKMDQIHIDIVDSFGNDINFGRGQMVVTLHIAPQDNL